MAGKELPVKRAGRAWYAKEREREGEGNERKGKKERKGRKEESERRAEDKSSLFPACFPQPAGVAISFPVLPSSLCFALLRSAPLSSAPLLASFRTEASISRLPVRLLNYSQPL